MSINLNRLRRAGLSLLGAAALVLGGPTGVSAQDIVLKTGTSWNDKFPMAKLLREVLDSSIKQHSQGKMALDVHLAGSLCNEKTCVEQVKLGQLDIGTASVANYGGFHKTYEVLTLPYIFSDDAAAERVLNGYLFEELDRISVSSDKMKVLAVVPFLGFRQLETNVGIVKSPADLRGTKVRVTKSPLDGALLRSWGAVATPIAWAETYDALQQKVVRGLYIQRTVHAMMKFYEVTPNVTLTNGAWTPMLIFMDRKRFEQVPDWAQMALDKSAADLRAKVFEVDAQYADRLGAANKDKIQYYTPSKDEMAQWRKASAKAWLVGKKLNLYDPSLARRILESQEGIQDFVAELESIGAL